MTKEECWKDTRKIEEMSCFSLPNKKRRIRIKKRKKKKKKLKKKRGRKNQLELEEKEEDDNKLTRRNKVERKFPLHRVSHF